MTSTPPAQDEHDALPVGTRVGGEFEIIRVLGIGGFGIVYLAIDHALDRLVALKEYMPSMMAGRGNGPQVSLRSSLHEDTFNIGLRSFMNEAKLLARFNHPSLVKVYRFWEGNGTAYMAMPYYPGRTLRDERRSMLNTPSEAWLRSLVDPLLGAMDALHRENVYHRDIAPDNILMMPDGPPILLDFGAARSVIGDRTQALTAVLKPSYAPIEQYADVGHLRQGAWTDLYALGAVLHFVVMGRPPTPSASRAVCDEQPLLASLTPEQTGALPQKILRAIDWALTVNPHTRPQSVQAFRDALDGRIIPTERTTLELRSLNQVPSRAAPSEWAKTLKVSDVSVNVLDPELLFEPSQSENSTSDSSSKETKEINLPLDEETNVEQLAPAEPPVPMRPSVAEDEPAHPDTAKPAKNTNALPPVFSPSASLTSAPPVQSSKTFLIVSGLGLLLSALMGSGYWLLKDRLEVLLSPNRAGPSATASAPTQAPPVVPLQVKPAPSAIEPAPPPVVASEPITTAPPEKISVPDWSTSPARPSTTLPAAASAASEPNLGASSPAVEKTASEPSPIRTPDRPTHTRPKHRPAAQPKDIESAPASPHDICNARDTGTMSTCLRRVCVQGGFIDHPQCQELRRNDQW